MELLDPAIKGTTGILKAINKYAPSVRRVVLTSSFASMVNETKAPDVYDESCWNPVSWEDATTKRNQAYRGSKAREPESSITTTMTNVIPTDLCGEGCLGIHGEGEAQL